MDTIFMKLIRFLGDSLRCLREMAWLIQVNGLIVDARHASREIQEEAFRRGLIPYLP